MIRRKTSFWAIAGVAAFILSTGCQEAAEPAPTEVNTGEPAKAAPEAAASDKTPATPSAQAAKSAPAASADPPKGNSDLRLKDLPNAGKASASDGQSLADAKKMVDTMARELKRSTAAVVMAGKDKAKVDAIGADFQKLNKTMTKQMEAVSEKLTPEELVAFEEYTRVKLSPLINSLLQAFFSAGGFASGGGGPNGTTKLVQQAPPTPAPMPATSSTTTSAPQATPVAAALGAGAAGAPTPTQPNIPAARPTPAPTGADSLEMTVAKGAVDAMASDLRGIVTRIRQADNDKGKLRQINLDYTAINQKHGSKLPMVVQALKAEERPAFDNYLKGKLMPVSSELVQAFTEAGIQPAK